MSGLHSAEGMTVVIPDYWPDVSTTGSITTVEMTSDEKEHLRQQERARRQNGQVPVIGFAPREELA